ncbi:hypothetical protein B0H14DRAFT_2771269 [Mycena olivaceomarginata]|nr:hypothetical protein B0H14DRAFT_2771269 [Mycena olivaceomarginata]
MTRATSSCGPLSSTTRLISLNPVEQQAADNNSRAQATAVTVSPFELRPRSKIQRQEEILERFPTPLHWRAPELSHPFSRLKRLIFNLLCITSFGHAGLNPVWAAIRLEEEGDESVWSDGINPTCDRLNNMLLVANLLLGTSAVFITTTPPRASTINYTNRGPYICIGILTDPYICMLGSFGLLIGGIIVASVCVFVCGKARPYWSEQVSNRALKRWVVGPICNRFHVYSTLIMLSYPIFSIGAAAILLAFGVLTAIWSAEDLGVQAAAALLLFLPISMAILFGVSCATAVARTRLRKELANS